MPARIQAFDNQMNSAVRHFWRKRRSASKAQSERGASDRGNRASVTSGKNLDGFANMVRQIIIDNGISAKNVHTSGRSMLTIPGFYRPTKNWDLLVVQEEKLLAAVEFKSQVGPSFGNNFNNRVEEAVGNVSDLLTAFREGAFGEASRPFIGYFFVLEDCEGSNCPVGTQSPHFGIFPEFNETSYAQRYDLLCRKLVQENLYDAACLVLTKNEKHHRDLSVISSARRFATSLAGRIGGLALD